MGLQKTTQNTEYTIEQEELEQFIDLIYSTDYKHNYISILQLQGKNACRKSVMIINAKEVLSEHLNEEGVYLSINSHLKWGKHTATNVVRLNALAVDLDYYKIPHLKELKAMQVIGLMELDINYPTPSFYIDSGNGLYIYWLLESTYATTKSKDYWSSTQRLLADKFKEFGADASISDAPRVLRMVGSTNQKTKNICTFIDSPLTNLDRHKRYEMKDFWEYFDEYKEPYKINKHKAKSKKKVRYIHNIYTLNIGRATDLEKLVELRVDANINTGYRELLIFMYMLHVGYANDMDYIQKGVELNSKFNIPLPQKEVTNCKNTLDKIVSKYHKLVKEYEEKEVEGTLNDYLSKNGCYMYRNQTILDQLGISQEEQKHLKVLIGTEEKSRRKQVRNKSYYEDNKSSISNKKKKKYVEEVKKAGKVTRKDKNKEIRGKIKALRDEGLSLSQIALELNLSTKTIKKHISNS